MGRADGTLVQDLERLVSLKNDQVISEEDYQLLKTKLLKASTNPTDLPPPPPPQSLPASPQTSFYPPSKSPTKVPSSNVGPRTRRNRNMYSTQDKWYKDFTSGGDGNPFTTGRPLPRSTASSSVTLSTKSLAAKKAAKFGNTVSTGFGEHFGRDIQQASALHFTPGLERYKAPVKSKPLLELDILPKPQMDISEVVKYKKKDPREIYDRIPETQLEKFRRAFASVDSDRDGIIKSTELVTVVRILGGNPTDIAMKYLSDLLKTTESTRISSSIDFLSFCRLMCTLWDEQQRDWWVDWPEDDVHAALQSLDTDKDGSIAPDELIDLLTTCGECLTKEEAEQLISVAPLDRNGFIDVEALADFLMSN